MTAGSRETIFPLGEYTLRRATNRDLACVWNLISAVLGSYGLVADRNTTDTDLTDLEGHFWNQSGAFYVLLERGTVIGTVALRPISDTACELCRMYLAADHRGKGLGRQLLAQALSEARARGYQEMHLKTASVLREAIALYKGAGFVVVEEAAACGNCDVVMRKVIQ